MSRDKSPEPRTWDEPEELERIVHELREQIDGLRARVRVYRELIGGEDSEDEASKSSR